MSEALIVSKPDITAIEQTLMVGDLAKLNIEQRLSYYNAVCESVGLNPLTRPFDYITLNSKLTLYAKRDATDQLRKIYNVSITITSREKSEDIYIVTAQARLPNNRVDEASGAVNINNLKGENLANALMKAETKAKRRVTLSICGLGLMDETEVSDIRDDVPASGNRFGEPPRLLKTFEEHFEQEKKEALEVLAKCGIEIPSKPPHKSTAFPFGANVSDPPPNPDASSPQPPIQPSTAEIGPAGQENAEVPKSPQIAKKISPAKRGVLFAAVRESTRPDWTGRDEKTRQAELKKVLLTLKTEEYPDGITSSLQIPDVSFDLILAWVKTGTFGALRAVVGQ